MTRWRVLLPSLWLAWVTGLALAVAPVAFAVLPRVDAGRMAGALFGLEARASLVLALLLFFIERRIAAQGAERDEGSRVSAELLLVLGALFCTVLGYYALQPMMAAARNGSGPYSFGLLHGASTVFFGLKGVLLAVLVWRVTRPDPGRPTSIGQ